MTHKAAWLWCRYFLIRSLFSVQRALERIITPALDTYSIEPLSLYAMSSLTSGTLLSNLINVPTCSSKNASK